MLYQFHEAGNGNKQYPGTEIFLRQHSYQDVEIYERKQRYKDLVQESEWAGPKPVGTIDLI